MSGSDPDFGLVWAQTANGVIGRDGTMPWHLPEDLARFREVTAGSTVVMGRRTWDGIPPRFRPLPGRRNIVVTRDDDWAADGAERAGSIDDALLLAAGRGPVWVIGGGEVYRATIDRASVLEVTEIDLDVEGDAFAPSIGAGWSPVGGEHGADGSTASWSTAADGLRYRFRRYERTPSTDTL